MDVHCFFKRIPNSFKQCLSFKDRYIKKYQCVLFDLDGVILDTTKYHYQLWKETANTFDHNITHKDNDQIKGQTYRLTRSDFENG